MTAKGTAVVERIIIVDPVEMVSVYHLDRAGLVMDLHMHSKELRLLGPDRLAFVWETFLGGRTESVDTMLLARATTRP